MFKPGPANTSGLYRIVGSNSMAKYTTVDAARDGGQYCLLISQSSTYASILTHVFL
jgi:hypothetical protein